ncbi:SGNH/GDSL hydrolase family protein [Herpetosiphon sp. NSE202]|uniref:SGNH/GDSL hydrolase family protein n=1 Tax=Herpetosiphon sp. NSE202 TaxID=3351349 RepID=UPI00362DE9D7
MAGPLVLQVGDCTVACSYALPHQRGDALLQSRLRSIFGDETLVCNEGLDGEATEDFLKRYDRTMARYPEIDLIIVRYGVNDRKRYGIGPFEAKLIELCDLFERDYPQANIMLETGIYVDYPAHYAFDRNSKLEPVYRMISKLAQQRGYTVVDIFERMKRETQQGNWDLRARGFGSVDEDFPVLGPALDHIHGHDVRWFTNIHPNIQGIQTIVDEEISVITQTWPTGLRAIA